MTEDKSKMKLFFDKTVCERIVGGFFSGFATNKKFKSIHKRVVLSKLYCRATLQGDL